MPGLQVEEYKQLRMHGRRHGVITVLHPLQLSDFVQLKLHHYREERVNVVRVVSLNRPDMLVAEVIKLT